MPPGCARTAHGNQSHLRENRRLFVRAQTVRLENECRVVKRTLWRSDGCALDWVLDRDNGTYREWWPAECGDRAAFARSVAARCRALGADRRVLSVKQLPDVVEVAWTTIVEVPAPPEAKKPAPVSKIAILLHYVLLIHYNPYHSEQTPSRRHIIDLRPTRPGKPTESTRRKAHTDGSKYNP